MRLYLSLAAQTSDLESAIGQEAVDNSWLDSTPQDNNNNTNNNNWYANNSNANGSCRPTDDINFLDPQVSSSLCLHTLQRKSHLYIPFLGIARPMSVSDFYIPRIGPHISCSRIGRSIVGIYKWVTDS